MYCAPLGYDLGGWSPVDHRHLPGGMAAVGAFLLVDAITEVSLASWTRHRELRRRADEEMALVAEELGA